MKWKAIVAIGGDAIQIPDNWLFSHYYEALNALFRIENTLRVFVYVVLKNEFKEKWLGINIVSDDAAESTIGKIAKQRMNQTKRFGYLGYLIPCPLMYMTSGELIRLITSDSYWKHFSAYFLGSKEIIKNKLDEISSVRNALAHFRPIREDDVDLVKQNARHVLSKIEACLTDIIRCANIVPTNTEEEWYKELKTLGTGHCRFSFNQSDDERWVKVSLEYNCPLLFQRGVGQYRSYRVLNLNTPAILHGFPELQALLIFLSEQIPYHTMKDDDPGFRKRAIMVFSRGVLTTEYEVIKQQIEKLLLKISEETGLLQDDNLARGELVQAVSASASCKKLGDGSGHWSFDTDGFKCHVRENDPPEYWGQLNYAQDDYVTSTDDYPWMPVSVSKSEIPF
jgi:hypothetical protein